MATLHLGGQIRSDVSLLEAEAAIRRLDGAAHTLLRVELSSGSTLTIGGGPGSFVVELAEPPTDRWCVVDPTRGPKPLGLVVGGSLGHYPGHLCVGIEAALEAARAFLGGDGERSARLIWSMKT